MNWTERNEWTDELIIMKIFYLNSKIISIFFINRWRQSFSCRTCRDRQILHHGKLSRIVRLHLRGLRHAHEEHGPLHLLRLCQRRRNGRTFRGTDGLDPPDSPHRNFRPCQRYRRIPHVLFARDQRSADASNSDGKRGHVDRRYLLEQPFLVLQAGKKIRIREDLSEVGWSSRHRRNLKRPLAFDIYYAWRTPDTKNGCGNVWKQQIVARLVPAMAV